MFSSSPVTCLYSAIRNPHLEVRPSQTFEMMNQTQNGKICRLASPTPGEGGTVPLHASTFHASVLPSARRVFEARRGYLAQPPASRIAPHPSTLQPGYENHETNPVQNDVSNFTSVTSPVVALIALEQRTQFTPDNSRGWDSLSPPETWRAHPAACVPISPDSAIRTPQSALNESNLIQPNRTKKNLCPLPSHVTRHVSRVPPRPPACPPEPKRRWEPWRRMSPEPNLHNPLHPKLLAIPPPSVDHFCLTNSIALIRIPKKF